MGERYDLPGGVGRPNPMLRTLLVWGVPLLAWILLIVGWLAFADGCDGTPKPDTPPAEPQPAAPTEQPAPAKPEAPAEPAKPAPAPAKPRGRDGAYPQTPYDFAGAVSHIGLPQENGCGTGILAIMATKAGIIILGYRGKAFYTMWDKRRSIFIASIKTFALPWIPTAKGIVFDFTIFIIC